MNAEPQQNELKFIDKNALDVILKALPDKFKDQDKETFEDIRRKTENEKEKFHDKYNTAKEDKKSFLQNVRSRPAQKLDKDPEELGLPTLPQLKDKFMELCKKLEI